MEISFSISAFKGKPRAGKTLSCTNKTYNDFLNIKIYCHEHRQKKRTSLREKAIYEKLRNIELWSNLKLSRKIFGDYRYIEGNELFELLKNKVPIRNKILCFDDIFKDMHARRAMTDKNIILSNFTTEIGKRDCILNYVTHFEYKIEKDLRQMTENFIVCEKGRYKKIKISRNKYITVFEEDKDYFKLDFSPETMIIKNIVLREDINFIDEYSISEKKIFDKYYIRAKKIFKMYDTEQVI